MKTELIIILLVLLCAWSAILVYWNQNMQEDLNRLEGAIEELGNAIIEEKTGVTLEKTPY